MSKTTTKIFTKKPKELVISRKKHLRGNGGGKLRNHAGAMCCLGFLARACGIPAKDLVGKDLPSDLSDSDLKNSPVYASLTLRFGDDNSFANEAARINDDEDISRTEREKRLIKLFKNEPQIKLKFKD
jgi:hypothetical protein